MAALLPTERSSQRERMVAVLSRLARQVYSVERHRKLADSARGALESLKYTNVQVRHGDGSLGWTDAAPFDAILVAAGGPEIPEALRRQLKIGGRLIIPIGELGGIQELVKVVRDAENRFHEEDLGPVTFVPLIGEAGWAEPAVDAAPAFARLWPKRSAVSARAPAATQLIRDAAEPLPDPDDPAFGAIFDRFSKARVVLLGEATHGTSEFYRARAQITRRLIERYGFNIVAVEADWPDAA